MRHALTDLISVSSEVRDKRLRIASDSARLMHEGCVQFAQSMDFYCQLTTHQSSIRKIIHVDMDAFFASVEQRDFPEYRGKPLAVGGSAEQRGVVAAASYEARRYGVHSAMPSRIATQRCPHLILVRPRFDVYREVSEVIREIFHRYTDLVEPLSLDEAYLDVSVNKFEMPSATLIAREIKAQILEETG